MAEVEKQENASPKKKWTLQKKVFTIVGVAFAIFLVIALTATTATEAPLKVSNQLVNNIQASDSSGAYNLLSNEAKKVVSQDDFATVVNQIGPILNSQEKVTSREVTGETGQAATAIIAYEIRGNDGMTYDFVVNLTKENGEWRVLNFDSSKQ